MVGNDELCCRFRHVGNLPHALGPDCAVERPEINEQVEHVLSPAPTCPMHEPIEALRRSELLTAHEEHHVLEDGLVKLAAELVVSEPVDGALSTPIDLAEEGPL